MSKRKEGLKDLKLIGAAMADMEMASELGLQNQQPSQNQVQHQATQQAQIQRAERFEQLAQQAAKESAQKAQKANNLT